MKQIFTAILLLLLLASCKEQTESNNSEPTHDKIDLENEAMADLFLKLVDTVSYKQMFLPSPDFKKDSVDEEKEEFIKRIIMVDSINPVNKELIKQLELLYNTKITLPNNKPGYKFDYKVYSENKKYNFIDPSETKLDSIWGLDHNNVNGIISFSRIQFDNTQKLGALSAGFTAGPKAGRGFIIFIKLENNKWIIDKVTRTWIS